MFFSRCKITFATSSSSASSVFGGSKADSKSTSAILLGSVLKQTLPVFEPQAFVTSVQQHELDDNKNQDSTEEDESFELQEKSVKIHGSNQVVEDLKLSYSSNSSTEVIDQLRVKSSKKEFNPSPVQSVDFTAIKNLILQESTTVEIFDPYKTIAAKDRKKDPFIKAMPKTTSAPRLTSTPASGNRIATFTQKTMKK